MEFISPQRDKRKRNKRKKLAAKFMAAAGKGIAKRPKEKLVQRQMKKLKRVLRKAQKRPQIPTFDKEGHTYNADIDKVTEKDQEISIGEDTSGIESDSNVVIGGTSGAESGNYERRVSKPEN